MNAAAVEGYLSHYHLRDILDSFVNKFIRAEYEKNGVIGAGSVTARQASMDGTVSGNATAAAEAADAQPTRHPQQHVVTVLREFLEQYTAERDAWRASHRYIILAGSRAPSAEAAGGDDAAATTTDPHIAEAMRLFARQVAEVAGASVLLPPSESVAGANSAAQHHNYADLMRGADEMDDVERQKRKDKFRLSSADALMALMSAHAPLSAAAAGDTAPAAPAVIVAEHWPTAIGDALAIEHVLGKPQAVVYFCRDEDADGEAAAAAVSEEGVEGPAREAAEPSSPTSTQQRLQWLSTEATFTSPVTERAALLAYYTATHVLARAVVTQEGTVADAALLTRIVEQLAG